MSRWAGWGAVTSGGVGESSWGDCGHNTGDPVRPGTRRSRGEGPRPRPRYLHPRDPPPDGKGLLPTRPHMGSKAFSLETFSQCPPEKEAPRTELCADQRGPASSWLSHPTLPPSRKAPFPVGGLLVQGIRSHHPVSPQVFFRKDKGARRKEG